MSRTMADIGLAAGDVWRCLAEHGPASADVVKRRTKLGSNVFYAAVGWLAREDKLTIREEGRKLILELKNA